MCQRSFLVCLPRTNHVLGLLLQQLGAKRIQSSFGRVKSQLHAWYLLAVLQSACRLLCLFNGKSRPASSYENSVASLGPLPRLCSDLWWEVGARCRQTVGTEPSISVAPSQGYRKPHLGLSRGHKSRNCSRASMSHRWDRVCRPPAPGSRWMVLDISFFLSAFGSLPCSLQNPQVGHPYPIRWCDTVDRITLHP